MYHNILVPVDRSELAEKAIETAINVAKDFDARIVLIHVLEIIAMLPKAKEKEYKALRSKAEEYMAKMMRKIEEKGVSAEAVIKRGEPSLVICEYAKRQDIDLIIMTNAGKSRVWFDRSEIGSVAEKVLNHSPKHVLLVRSGSEDILKGRKILAVDDEPDILETIEDILDMCVVYKATDDNTAREYIRNNRFDIAILDIMGVGGFDLLKETVSRGIPSIMLTAHALTSESLTKAATLGAVSFFPKEKMMDLQSVLEDIILENGKPAWQKLLDRLAPYFRKRFGWSPEDEDNLIAKLKNIETAGKK